MIKPAYSVSFLVSINIFVWQNVLYFLDAPRMILRLSKDFRSFRCKNCFIFLQFKTTQCRLRDEKLHLCKCKTDRKNSNDSHVITARQFCSISTGDIAKAAAAT